MLKLRRSVGYLQPALPQAAARLAEALDTPPERLEQIVLATNAAVGPV